MTETKTAQTLELENEAKPSPVSSAEPAKTEPMKAEPVKKNPMKEIKVEKITLNIGSGKD